MKKKFPEVYLKEHTTINIEVMKIRELFQLLNQAKEHNPFEPHKINFYLILYLTNDTYTHFIDFHTYTINQGAALFVAKNQVHHFNTELKNAEGFCIIFDHLFVDKHYLLTDSLRLNRLFNYHIESPILSQEQIGEDNFIDLCADLYTEYHIENSFAKPEILASLLRVLLLKAERAKKLQAVTNVNLQWLEIFNKFKNLLEIDHKETRNSKKYAVKLLVSYKFLNDVVKKLTNKTVKTFIDDYVTMEIKRYLTSTSLSIKEISYETGFEEPANMIKFFKKNAGITPLKFRQQLLID